MGADQYIDRDNPFHPDEGDNPFHPGGIEREDALQIDETLRLYAVIRDDLGMTPGKLASQAGHAFLNAFLEADPQVQEEYQRDGIGTKVTLKAKNEEQILKIYEKAKARNLPCSLIIDSGHVMEPFFDGSPIITALGIGPVKRNAVKQTVKSLKLI